MIDWTPCEIGEHAASCAVVALPLDPADPAGATFDVDVARIPAPSPPARGQLWFVTGGPGDAGVDDLAAAAAAHIRLAPDLDLVTFDHRGTGGSTRLSCPVQEDPDSADGFEIVGDEWGPCVDHVAATYGDLLPHVTVTAAAADLVALTDLVAGPDDEVYWWGLSYGTYLVQRALFLAPARPTGVLLDGLVPADFDFARFDAGLDEVAQQLLAQCADAAVCAAHLGPDPEAAARALLADLDAGHCAGLGLDAPTARLLAGVFLQRGDEYPTLIPPMIHRLHRCAGRDKRAFVHMFDELFPEGGGGLAEKPGHSPVAQRHLAYGDLWGPAVPPLSDLQAVVDRSVATTEVSLRFAETAAGWPGLPAPDPRDGAYPPREVPVLAIHGGLDPTGPVDRLDGLSAWLGDGLVIVPYVHHVTLNYGDCPVGIQAAFLADPTAPLDTSCVAEVSPPDFAGDAAFDERIWGTADRWGDERCGCATPSGGPLAGLLAALGLRRRPRPSSSGR
jgi:pimeloyl-ACP methyl ester carboxylesterase